MAARSSRKKTTRKKKAARRKASSAGRKRARSSKKRSKAGSRKKKKKKVAARGRRPAGRSASKKKKKKKKVARSKKKATRGRAGGKKATAKRRTSKKKSATARSSQRKKTTTKRKKTSTGRSKAAAAPKAAADDKKTSEGKAPGTAKIQRGRSVVEVATASTADAQGYVVINGRRVRMISTKNNNGGKKKKKKRRAAAADAPKAADAKPIKSKLTKRELNTYRKFLLIKRAEIVGDLSAMEAEALRSSDGDLSNMPIHMADLGSDTYEQDFMLGMAETERQRIREIDEALQRIENRTYGICQMTGKPIPKARLEAKPWAKYTIEAARQLEGTWGR